MIQKVVHLTFKKPYNGIEQLYFGSLKAIYDTLSAEAVGIKYSSLKNLFGKSSDYENKLCVIHVDELRTARRVRKQ